MPESFDLMENTMVALTRDALTTLRSSLFRDVGANAASYLQEAGYASGAALYEAFRRWLAGRGLGAPESLAADQFTERATDFFRALGWGSVELGSLHDAIVVIDSDNWAEADPGQPLEFPGCHVSTGMLADFFGRLAGNDLAVMEVECRSMGAPRCRFLLASAEVMQHVYDEMERGLDYSAAADSV